MAFGNTAVSFALYIVPLAIFLCLFSANGIDEVNAASSSLTAAAPCPCSDPALCQPITTTPKKELLAFCTGSSYWKQYDWDSITTVALFGPYDNDLMCYAHSRGVRIQQSGTFPSSILTNNTAMKEWAQDALNKAVANHMDGINLDIEWSLQPQKAPLLTSMVKMVADAFHEAIPHSLVTFDASNSPKCKALRCYDYKGIADVVDYLMIMAYDELVLWSVAMANAPIDQTVAGIEAYLQLGVPRAKLVLGVPWYGYVFACSTLTKSNVCYCAFGSGSEINYVTLAKLLDNNSTSGRLWNDVYKSPYFNYKDESTGQMHQIWYDDPMSLNIRYDYAKQTGLYGVGMWTADSVDYSDNPLAKNQTKAMWDSFASFVKP